jgi:hypothetical protein
MYIREEWIQKSTFHDCKTEDVLREVVRRVDAVKAQGKLPILIFDLDSTLFDVSRRSYEILREWIQHAESASFAPTRQELQELSPRDMRYSLQDVWQIKNLDPESEPHASSLQHAKRFWRKRFFGNDYLIHDEPTEGAVEFVQSMYDRGAKIVYLTGRDVPLMSFGTFDQLKRHRLPVEQERTRLILKPKRHLDDLDFKSQTAALISTWGKVVASFENEPKNLVAMSQVLGPETMHVFIQTVSSDHPAPVATGVYRIENFKITDMSV